MITLLTSTLGYAGEKPPYTSASVQTVQEQVGKSKKIGEADGDVYYYKSAGGGTGQLFRVSQADGSKYALVGTIINNKYMILPAEKSGFFALVTDQPAASITGDSTRNQQFPPSTSYTSQQQNQPGAADSAAATSAIAVNDAGTRTVQFKNDSKFHNDKVIFFEKGEIEIKILRVTGQVNGEDAVQLVARLWYEGGGPDSTAAGKVGRGITHVFVASASDGRKADLFEYGWNEWVGNYGGNTAAAKNRGQTRGVGQANGLEAEVLTATDVYRKQIEPNFQYPGEDRLRERAGLPRKAATTSPQQ